MDAIVWGICLIFLGVSLFGSFTGLFNVFFEGWWTLFIIIPSVIDLIRKKNKFISLIVLSVGVILLLQQQGIVVSDMAWKIMASVAIILVGVQVIMNRNGSNKRFNATAIDVNTSHNVTFGDRVCNYDGKVFTGDVISVTFGSMELDLSNSIIDKDVVINLEVVFGGCKVIVPKNVNVKIDNKSFFGGVNSKINTNNPELKTIHIKSKTIFGGVDVI